MVLWLLMVLLIFHQTVLFISVAQLKFVQLQSWISNLLSSLVQVTMLSMIRSWREMIINGFLTLVTIMNATTLISQLWRPKILVPLKRLEMKPSLNVVLITSLNLQMWRTNLAWLLRLSSILIQVCQSTTIDLCLRTTTVGFLTLRTVVLVVTST